MGLLDDAIREHLELKRRRGADPDEVAREQQEALDSATALHEDHGEAHDGDEGKADVSGAPLVDPGEPAAVAAPTAKVLETKVTAQPPPTVPPAGTTMGETAELDMSSVLGEDPDRDADSAPTAPVRGDGDPLEWEMPGDAQTGEDQEPDEDVLEETPDFLRETPEQERLWFEQRPPRDFDFDK